ncbi:MAG: beta-mannosidase [Ruminococcus sp.]|nr:beta-mannosidase [Ruminococcus sp.]
MKGLMKKALSLCAAAALTLSLAGCGDSGESSSAAESAAPASSAESDPGGEQGGESKSADAGSGIEREPLVTEPVVEKLENFDLSDVQNETAVSADFSLELEAEKASLEGKAAVLKKSSMGDYSGEGYVIITEKNGEAVFDVKLDVEGNYDLGIISARASEDSVGVITLDGSELMTFNVASKKFQDNGPKNITLPAGEHKLGIKSSKSNCFVDRITLSGAATVDLEQYKVKKELANPNASEETRRLYSFLTDIYGKYTLSGQYSGDNMGSSSAEFYVIEQTTGKKPAILGLDLIELSPSRLAHGSSGGEMVPQQAIEWWRDNGGIVTLCWHWNAPEPYLEQDSESPWWKGFYSANTNFSLKKALDKEDEEGYNYLIRDIDAIAKTLAYLDDQHVPVLWRPLHEGGGDPKWHNPWFWWGSSGADAYIGLWKLMYDRLTNVHHINNLIWVWNGQDPTYYPGDEYVDIIGYDIYAEKGDTSSQKEIFDLMKSVTDEKKIIVLSENGVIPDPDECFSDGSRWGWFATWNGEFMIDGGEMKISDYTGEEKAKKIYNSERVLTLDELPDLKCYPLDSAKYLSENAG